MTALLEVRGLSATATAPDGTDLPLVLDVDLSLGHGERLALVGESGSGKSVTARALLRLDDSIRLGGSVKLDGRELLSLTERELETVRGAQIAMVFQDPLSALNPLMTVGDQVAEPLRCRGVGRREARRRALAMLGELEIPDAGRRMRAYPHEFSGGMRQRVVLAMALVGEPALLVADEPTTALDVRVQAQVMSLIGRIADERRLSVVLITHDVGVVAGFADRVAVMYSGRIVEQAPAGALFGDAGHPYTRGLLGAVPRIDLDVERLAAMLGGPPSPGARPTGCAFCPRCPIAVQVCREELPLLTQAGDPSQQVACHRSGEAVVRTVESDLGERVVGEQPDDLATSGVAVDA